MKALILVISLALSSNLFAKTHEISGNSAKNLFEALYISGVEAVVHDNGDMNSLDEENITCRRSYNHEVGGLFETKPECYAQKKDSTQGWNFDQKLEETTQLWKVLETLEVDADGAMGSFYLSANKVYCTFEDATHAFKCRFETEY